MFLLEKCAAFLQYQASVSNYKGRNLVASSGPFHTESCFFKTTLDLYSHDSETMQEEAATKLDSALRSAIKANSALKDPQLG